MVTKGGYKLIDFGGVDISTSKTISGIYNRIADTGKRIVGCNIVLGTTKFKELTLDVKANGTSYELSNSILKITITNANAVVGEVVIIPKDENYSFDTYADLKAYILEKGGYYNCIIAFIQKTGDTTININTADVEMLFETGTIIFIKVDEKLKLINVLVIGN